MAGILTRFKNIMAANVNALLDKAEDPEKMIDQYLRNMENDLRTVKAETAAVMAEERGARRRLNECEADIAKMTNYAKKALTAGNESDARAFLAKKGDHEGRLAGLQKELEAAAANATKMRQMHDKLNDDISDLNSRRSEIKAKMKMAKTAQRMNDMTSSSGFTGNKSAFAAMESKANRMMDEADAMLELNSTPSDSIDDLTDKYDDSPADSPSVNDELAKMKEELGL